MELTSQTHWSNTHMKSASLAVSIKTLCETLNIPTRTADDQDRYKFTFDNIELFVYEFNGDAILDLVVCPLAANDSKREASILNVLQSIDCDNDIYVYLDDEELNLRAYTTCSMEDIEATQLEEKMEVLLSFSEQFIHQKKESTQTFLMPGYIIQP